MKTMNLRRFSLGFMLCVLTGLAVAAVPNPVDLLKSTTNQLFATLKQNRQALKQNPKNIYKIVDRVLLPIVDLRVMSMSVLGRNAWGGASDTERDQFTKAFTTTVVKTYSSALSAYTDEGVKFFPIRGGFQDTRVLTVNSEITRPDGPSVPVSYAMILANNHWKVYDLNVEGISLLQSFRSQFASSLASGKSVANLISQLKTHNAKMA
jgi:phospholipid transport system substrate-binding protein